MASTTTPDTSKELLARVDDAWRPFPEAVRGVGRARMNEPTGSGWTFRDLLAHLAGWHDLNARLVSSHRLVGAEALVDELDTTFRAVRSELTQLTDDQVRANDGWVSSVVGGNTYGHYEEHAKELGLE